MRTEFKVAAPDIQFEGDIDVDWFCEVPNGQVARERLEFLCNPTNITELMKRGYGGAPLTRMWQAVYRACLAFDEPIPTMKKGHAESLGVSIPT